MARITSFILLSCILLTGCGPGKRAYYLNPLHGLNSPYRTIPMQSDNIRSATYIHAFYSAGDANQGGTDDKRSVSAGISRSHNKGMFQYYYGAGLSLGKYRINKYDSLGNHATVDYRLINQHAGSYFFGGSGADVGVNIVFDYKDKEWRAIGITSSIQQEFGDYLAVRKSIPDSAATLVMRSPFYSTLGAYSEFIMRTGTSQTGIKIGWGKLLGKKYNPPGQQALFFNYFNFTCNWTYRDLTFYLQGNLANKSQTAFIGINYKL